MFLRTMMTVAKRSASEANPVIEAGAAAAISGAKSETDTAKVDGSTSPSEERPAKKRKRWGKRNFKRNKRMLKKMDPEKTLPEGVLTKFEIPDLVKSLGIPRDQMWTNTGEQWNLFLDDVIEGLKIERLDVKGDGLAIVEKEGKKAVAVVPFGLPGDIVKVKLGKFVEIINGDCYVKSDLLEVTESGNMRLADDKIPCKYYGVCSGCQYQAVGYENQLKQKRQTIVNAYRYLVNPALLEKEDILSKIGDTVASPTLMGYRTKLTPHYDMSDLIKTPAIMPHIGFESKGRPSWRFKDEITKVIDIEDCPIGTEIVRKGMYNERVRIARKFEAEGTLGRKGVTVLLREDTTRQGEEKNGCLDPEGQMSEIECEVNGEPATKTCVTDHNATVHEYVNGLEFTFMANEFFQNNNSILPKVIEYVQGKLQLGGGGDSYLVDAYCGCGLFSIASASSVKKSLGVELSAQSIAFAKKNAALNKITNCEFIAGKAEKLFESIDFPRDQTSVILDPPRKGCDKVFLDQLSDFEPRRVVYVSCNVHSQARDVEQFLTETTNGHKYHVESVRGFDFFPQTYHVESVAVLTRE